MEEEVITEREQERVSTHITDSSKDGSNKQINEVEGSQHLKLFLSNQDVLQGSVWSGDPTGYTWQQGKSYDR